VENTAEIFKCPLSALDRSVTMTDTYCVTLSAVILITSLGAVQFNYLTSPST